MCVIKLPFPHWIRVTSWVRLRNRMSPRTNVWRASAMIGQTRIVFLQLQRIYIDFLLQELSAIFSHAINSFLSHVMLQSTFFHSLGLICISSSSFELLDDVICSTSSLFVFSLFFSPSFVLYIVFISMSSHKCFQVEGMLRVSVNINPVKVLWFIFFY